MSALQRDKLCPMARDKFPPFNRSHVPLSVRLEGHNGPMTDLLPARGDLDKRNRDEIIVRLKKAGATYRQIAEVMGVSKSQAQRVYRAATGEQFKLGIEQHRRDLYADLELLIEVLRPIVHDDEVPPHKDHVNAFLRVNKAKALLLGLETPKATTVTPVLSEGVDNPIAAERVARLAAFIERTRAISVEGAVRPPLPPGMTERVTVEPSNGHVHIGPHGQGMWSMVLEYPQPEDH